jgi:hypothetical protein
MIKTSKQLSAICVKCFISIARYSVNFDTQSAFKFNRWCTTTSKASLIQSIRIACRWTCYSRTKLGNWWLDTYAMMAPPLVVNLYFLRSGDIIDPCRWELMFPGNYCIGEGNYKQIYSLMPWWHRLITNDLMSKWYMLFFFIKDVLIIMSINNDGMR